MVPIDFYFEDIQIANANQLIAILKIFKAQKGRAYWFPHLHVGTGFYSYTYVKMKHAKQGLTVLLIMKFNKKINLKF